MKKSSWQNVLAIVAFMLVGALCGFFGVEPLLSSIEDSTILDSLLLGVFGLVVLLLAVFIQIVIHETGHLVFGLLSGYRFSLLRVGSFALAKVEGEIRPKLLSIAGTGGQCLLTPPQPVNGKFPFVLYNLGGPIFNFVTGLLFLTLGLLITDMPYITTICVFLGITGVASALQNAVPMRFGMVNNDGHNILSMMKSSEAAQAFWLQMQVSGLQADGVRLKDMPDEWFVLPSEEGMKNCLTASLGALYCNRLMDKHAFSEAAEQMDELLAKDSALVDLIRKMLDCDRIYCELIGENRKERVDGLLDKQTKLFMRSMRNYPSMIRTDYALALLAENDGGRAWTVKEMFEKRARSYPYAGGIESERELMVIAEKRFAERAISS
ncbi:MAG TPA: hypothetical protein DEB24_01125 [Coriobacteriia bacterium]|nr:hypothetical protein [Coriobacteriia bacterium]